jgi:hypothetical protein
MIEITDSSQVTGVEWDNGILRVRFRAGVEYEYFDCPYALQAELLAAPSKGKWINENLKGKYEYARV